MDGTAAQAVLAPACFSHGQIEGEEGMRGAARCEGT
jgi:hypothetical protein